MSRAPVDPDHLVAVEELARLVGPLVHPAIAQPFEPLDQREVARHRAGLDREGLRVDPRLVAPQLVLERGGVGCERKEGRRESPPLQMTVIFMARGATLAVRAEFSAAA